MFNNDKIKKFASFLILFVMFFNSGVSLATNLKTNQEEYVYEDEKQEILLKYKGSEKNIVLPDNIKIIKDSAFKDKGLLSIKLNEGLVEIEDQAFSNNQIEGEVVLPNSLQRIGNFAFADNNIEKIDLSKLNKDISLGSSIFQDNKISGTLDLRNLNEIPERMFMSNEIKDVLFSDELEIIKKEAFLANKLSNIEVNSSNVELEEDVFASNGRFIEVEGSNVNSEFSKKNMYGHIVNPINIIIRSIEEKNNGGLKRILSDKKIEFNPYNSDNFFSLNETSYYKPDHVMGYRLDKNKHENNTISFTPNKNNYILNVYYKKNPKPIIELNKDAFNELLSIKKEGSDISEEELLSLVNVRDYLGNDISKNIEVNPKKIINAEKKEYEISYTVEDSNKNVAELIIILPIAMDPMKIRIVGTEWQLEDFIYEDDTVVDLSEKGKIKAKTTPGLAIPHINPHTMEPIKKVDFTMSKIKDVLKPGDLVFGNPDNIIYIGGYTFNDSSDKLSSSKLSFPNIEYIGDSAFKNSNIKINLSSLSDIEYIGEYAFSNTDIVFENNKIEFSNLKSLERSVFENTKKTFPFPNIPQVEEIGSSAFRESGVFGSLPEMPNLKYIGDEAFYYTQINGSLPKMPNLEHIGNNAFDNTQISGSLPEMPNLEHIGNNAFDNTQISGSLPEMPNLEHIGNAAFWGTQINGSLPEMPKLEHLGNEVFKNTQISGSLPEMPNLEYIGYNAFDGVKISGSLPDMPKLEYIGSTAFRYTELSSLPSEFPNLKIISSNAFRESPISGPIPKMPKIKEIGGWIFAGTNIDRSTVLYINNDTKVDKYAFQKYNSIERVVLLTYDGKNAPNVPLSDHHILNPYNITLRAINSKGDKIAEDLAVLADTRNSTIEFKIPEIEGYIDSGIQRVNRSQIINGIYTYQYTSLKESIDKNGGNKYKFEFKSIDNEDREYEAGEKIDTNLKFSTVNEEILKNSKIQIIYDKNAYENFVINKINGISYISNNTSKGLINIVFEKDLPNNYDVSIPVSFTLKEGLLADKPFELNAYLYNDKIPVAYGSTKFKAVYQEPGFSSLFKNGDRVRYEGIVVKDLKHDYEKVVEIQPNLSNLSGGLDLVKIKYDVFEYENKDGKMSTVELLGNDWKKSGEHFIYEAREIQGKLEIPPLRLKLTNPISTEKAIVINSEAEVDVNTTLRDHSEFIFKDTNYLNIHVEERAGGGVLYKSIGNSHHRKGRHGYFYDNNYEKNLEFKWDLYTDIKEDMSYVEFHDYDLDKRMKYTKIDPEQSNVNIKLLDVENNILLEKTINEAYEIPTNLQKKVSSVKIIYYMSKKGDVLTPRIYTKLRDPESTHYNSENIDNINRFYNRMDMSYKTLTSEDKYKGHDYAFFDIVEDNKSLATEVRITSKPSDLSYGKIATSSFYLKSKDYSKKEVNNLKYTALIEPGHRLEDVMISPNITGIYDISKTSNGYTKIDFIFEDLIYEIRSEDTKFKLFDLKTTPENFEDRDLKLHGLLHSSSIYDIYNKGTDYIEEINTSKYSYDNDSAKVLSPEVFSIKKLIGNKDYVGSSLETIPGEEFFYRFEFINGTSTSKRDFSIIDVLPHANDYNDSSYSNELNLDKLKNLKLPEGFNIQYLNQDDPLDVSKYNIINSLQHSSLYTWSNTPNNKTKAIKITNRSLKPQKEPIRIDIPMITKKDLKSKDNGRININQFAYSYKDLGYDQALSNPVNQYAKIEVPKKDIKLKKVSVFMGEEDGVLEGVKFTLKNNLGKIIDTGYTNANGELIFKDVPVGDYTVNEVGIPEGYKKQHIEISITAEDMNKVANVLDLGKVKNHRIDSFNVLIKNVELIDDLKNINYKDLPYIYNREIKYGEFEVINNDTNVIHDIKIDERRGFIISLNPGTYTLKQWTPPNDNGLSYVKNDIEYQFEIDKFGNLLIGDGNGTSLINKEKQSSNTVYFPNTAKVDTQYISVHKLSDFTGLELNDAEFTMKNIKTGKEYVSVSGGKNSDGNQNPDGFADFPSIPPGLYTLKETKAPEGYALSNFSKVINIEAKSHDVGFDDYVVTNKKIRVNINKYKIIADKIFDKFQAEEIAKSSVSSTGGKFIVEDLGDFYQVREVWKDNNISVNGKTFSTDADGTIKSVEDSITMNMDTVLSIKNNTKIKDHYEPDILEEHILDYTSQEDFSGLIDIDIEVKPLKGAIYVSKYLIDENNKEGVKEGSFTNGAKYTLYVDKGYGFEEVSTKEIDNSNYVVFKDLDPNYSYKVREVYVPEGQEESEIKEYDVRLSDLNKYTATVVFRNYIPKNTSQITVKKVDGDTKEALEGVEFTLIGRNGQERIKKTNSKGEIVFDELEYDGAPYTLMETKALDGYRLNTKSITITEKDLDEERMFEVDNFKQVEIPETGTLGKLPFTILGIVFLSLAVVFKKRESLIE